VLSASVSYRIITENMDRTLKTTANKPQVARETEYYLKNIGDVKSVEEFLDDDRLFSYAMKAHGLSDMTYAKAFMRKALTEGIDEPTSFANKLADPRYKQFVETYNFARNGGAATILDKVKQPVADMFVRQTLEEDAGAQNEGARLALYFQRKAEAGDIKTVYNLLADKALLQVTQTAFMIPAQTSLMDIDKQAEMIEKRINVEDLKDPEKLKSFISRFTALWEISNGQSTANPTSAAVTILGGSSSGISGSVLSAIQNLKMGGR
jgi:hypothetical protein